MPLYEVRYQTMLSLAVTVHASDEDMATAAAHDQASEYLETITGDHRGVGASASLDGVGADEVEEVGP